MTRPSAYLFAFERPDGSWGAVTDDCGRLLASQYHHLAVLFSTRLEERGVAMVGITPKTPMEIAAFLRDHGTSTEQFQLIEAQTVNMDDAEQWAVELADRIRLAETEPAMEAE